MAQFARRALYGGGTPIDASEPLPCLEILDEEAGPRPLTDPGEEE